MDAPMPLEAPVTTATLPASFFDVVAMMMPGPFLNPCVRPILLSVAAGHFSARRVIVYRSVGKIRGWTCPVKRNIVSIGMKASCSPPQVLFRRGDGIAWRERGDQPCP